MLPGKDDWCEIPSTNTLSCHPLLNTDLPAISDWSKQTSRVHTSHSSHPSANFTISNRLDQLHDLQAPPRRSSPRNGVANLGLSSIQLSERKRYGIRQTHLHLDCLGIEPECIISRADETGRIGHTFPRFPPKAHRDTLSIIIIIMLRSWK